MIVVAAAMSAVGIVCDYFLKRTSGEASPLAMPAFLVGLALYSSTVRVGFCHALLKACDNRRDLFRMHDPDAHYDGLSIL